MISLRSILIRGLAVAAATVLAVAWLPTSAWAADASWTVRTASNDFGKNRTSFSYAVEPGGSISDELVVANHGTEPIELAIYAADGYTTETGQLDLLTTDQESVGIGAWVTPSIERVTIAPDKEQTVSFRVAVPGNASPGDYVGGIVTSLSSEGTSGVSVDRRLGIRIGLRVGGTLTPELAIDGVQMNWSGWLNPLASGDATISYTVHNNGNAVLSAQSSAVVTGPFGWFATQPVSAAEPPKLLPGESWTQSVQVPAVLASFVVFGTVTAVPLVVDASGSTSPLAPVTASGSVLALPVLPLVALVLVVGAVFLTIWLRRRAAAAQDARIEAAVRDALAGTGTSVPSPNPADEDELEIH